MPFKTFWIEPTDLERCWLRRYRSSGEGSPGCPIHTYHNVKVFLKDRPVTDFSIGASEDYDRPSNDSVQWPKLCDCGYAFQDKDPKQLFHLTLYKGAPDGKLYTLQDVQPGAMWHADWLAGKCGGAFDGPDGLSLHVKLPNGHEWCVDQEASNCTRTQWKQFTDTEGRQVRRWEGSTHYCWIRHGDPRTGNVHVDKNGDTCAAGAGSILSGSYHGFLHNGYLTDGC